MKDKLKSILALVCIFALCFGLAISAEAANAEEIAPFRASDHLAYYAACAISETGGKVVIEWDVQGTSRMDLIGVSYIVIQEKDGDKWKGVSTHFGSISNGMLDDNASTYVSSITFDGTPGKEYQAIVTAYAENGTGSDYRTIITNSVTAK